MSMECRSNDVDDDEFLFCAFTAGIFLPFLFSYVVS